MGAIGGAHTVMSADQNNQSQQATPAVLPEGAVDRLLSDVQTQSANQTQGVITRDGLLSITYSTNELLTAAQHIATYPSLYTVHEFKQTADDPAVLTAFNDPFVTLALNLKKNYDADQLSLITTLLQFNESKKVSIKDDRVTLNFKEEAPHFLGYLPDIRDEELQERALNFREPSPELYTLGKTRFMTEAETLIYMRFSEEEEGVMANISTYLMSKHIAAEWAMLYELVNLDEYNADRDVGLDEVFFTYLGGIVLANRLPYDEEMFTVMVAVLIEPIVRQFEGSEHFSEAIKEEFQHRMPNTRFELVHTTTHDNVSHVQHVVMLYAPYGSFLLGYGAGSTSLRAESKASAMALGKKNLDRLTNGAREIATYERTMHFETTGTTPVQLDAQSPLHPASTISQQVPPTHFPGYESHITPNTPAVVPPPVPATIPHSVYHTPSPAAGTLMGSTQMMMNLPPPSLINEEYQRQKHIDISLIPLVPAQPEDYEVDKASKQKLNECLTAYHCSSADYKTAKLSNTDVQVTCLIEGIPMARAIYTNKKTAGHLCASYILEHIDYFMQRLKEMR